MRDTVNMIRLGVPSVGLVHEVFRTLALLQVAQIGMPDAPLLIYPRDLPAEDPPDFVERKARETADQSATMLLKYVR